MATKSKWEQIAQQRLTTTRTDYMLGLQADGSMRFPDPFTGILQLKGTWPNMLESGFPAYDMKNGNSGGGFKGSSRAKRTKNGGWYLTIPFRHRTPDTVGSAVGGQAMPDDIYARARILQAKQGLKKAERLKDTESVYPARTSWNGYQHKSGIYENMVRNEKKYDKAIQSAYFTFRRVSSNSDPRSWWHPGFSGVKATKELEPWVRSTFQKVLNKNIRTALGG